jgi:tetratricopeptide (TPR) repeat protein
MHSLKAQFSKALFLKARLSKAGFSKAQVLRLITIVWVLSLPYPGVLAKTVVEDLPPPLTLEDLKKDSLLPDLLVDRPLSPMERTALRQSLDRLSLDASRVLAAGNSPQAFEMWFREIRLRRYLGTLDETVSLGQVGEQAWREGLHLEVRLITDRLQAIQTQLQQPLTSDILRNQELLEAIALSYQQVRALPQAIALYTELADKARETGALDALEQDLQGLAQAYLGALKHPEAAKATEELLQLVHSQPFHPDQLLLERQLVENLVFLHEQAQEWDAAIANQEKLINLYQILTLENKVPAVEAAIARNQKAGGQEDLAIATYQQAYRSAQLANQLGIAQDVINDLIEIYRQRKEPRIVLRLYQLLVNLHSFSADDYGLMETYNRLGKFYLDYNGYGQALEVYGRALTIAQYLKHRETEFMTKIEQLKQFRDLANSSADSPAPSPLQVLDQPLHPEQILSLDQALSPSNP